MSINPEALQKLLLEMDNQLNGSRAELSMCNLQMDRINVNMNIIQQTDKALHNLCDIEKNEKVWKGVGKCFLQEDVGDYLNDMSADEKKFKESKTNLEKKKHYLETTIEKTVDNMSNIVGRKA